MSPLFKNFRSEMKAVGNHADLYCLLLSILLINAFSVMGLKWTYDEGFHLQFGINVLNRDFDRMHLGAVGDSKMPISVLNAVPFAVHRLASQADNPDGKFSPLLLFQGRMVTVLFSILLGFYIYRWSRRLYGRRAGLLSLFLYTFSPNIIAHSQLITTDLYFVCFSTIATYYLWNYLNHQNRSNLFKSILSLSFVQITKYFAVLLYPLFGFLAILYSVPSLKQQWANKDWPSIRRRAAVAARIVLLVAVSGVLFINIAFCFNRFLTPLGQYRFVSDIGHFTQRKFSLLSSCPLFLPYSYVQGFDMVRNNERWYHRQTSGDIYFFGKIRPHPVPGYFFVAYLLKEPIASQIFLVLAMILLCKNISQFDLRRNEMFLLIPAVAFAVYLNFYFRAQLGIRYFLVVLPFLYVFCGSLLREGRFLSIQFKTIVWILCVYLSVSVFSYFPFYLSYFNEIVWDRKMAYRYLADSNLDWGANTWYLKEYLKRHPDVTYSPSHPTTGLVLVDVNKLVGIFDPKQYEWLRERYKPIGHVAYSYLLFDVPSKP